MKYKFRYRRRLPFWSTLMVIGHRFESDQDKMVLYFEDGSLREIKGWRSCELKLGVDWVLATKKLIEKEAGQEIVVSPN